MTNFLRYKTIIFDCDGVVLNSNRIKTNAFYHAALPYGEEAANNLVIFHIKNGGVSRYKKFEYFLENLVPSNQRGPTKDELLSSYAEYVWEGLLQCEVSPNLDELRRHTSHARWMIVSGGAQEELRELFRVRKLESLFDGGIFGSPDTKEIILERESLRGNIEGPAIFLGDSSYDLIVAGKAGYDFIFISAWSEDNEMLQKEGLPQKRYLKELVG